MLNLQSEYWTEIVTQTSLTEQQRKAIAKYKKRFVSEKQKLES